MSIVTGQMSDYETDIGNMKVTLCNPRILMRNWI
jgi:hypothetical protein